MDVILVKHLGLGYLDLLPNCVHIEPTSKTSHSHTNHSAISYTNLRLLNDANLYGEYGLLVGGPYRPPLPPPLS